MLLKKTRAGLLVVAFGLCNVGCQNVVRVAKLVEPHRIGAATETQQFKVAALHRSGKRTEIPSHGVVESTRVAFPNAVPVNGQKPYWQLYAGDQIEVKGEFTPGDRIPGGGYVTKERATFPLALGVATFIISYGPTAYIGLRSSRDYDRTLVIPFAGPWINLAMRPGCGPEPTAETGATEAIVTAYVECRVTEKAADIGLVISGAAQALSGVLIAVGLPYRVVVKDSFGKEVGIGMTPGGLLVNGTF